MMFVLFLKILNKNYEFNYLKMFNFLKQLKKNKNNVSSCLLGIISRKKKLK